MINSLIEFALLFWFKYYKVIKLFNKLANLKEEEEEKNTLKYVKEVLI